LIKVNVTILILVLLALHIVLMFYMIDSEGVRRCQRIW